MYSIPHSQQLVIFLTALGIGFLLGVVYDILRAIRLSITKSQKAHIFFDILYFLILTLTSYIFILAANKGEIRFYIIVGELLGLAFYYFSLGIAVIKATDIAVNLLRQFFKFIFKVISSPFRLAFRLFSFLKKKLSVFLKKTEKKSSKIQKKVLQKAHLYVYNLLGVFCARKGTRKKGGWGNGEKEKQEKAS